jgi:hypothetical protein
MNIKTSKDLKEALELAVKGDTAANILYDIARYLAYNYYMNIHVKASSPDDIENEKLYKEFQDNYPVIYKDIETIVDHIFERNEWV